MSVRYEVRVVQDPDPLRPDFWDNHHVFLVADGAPRYFNVEAPRDVDLDDEGFDTFPLYAYIHSGVVLSLGSFRCPWDSGLIGRVFVQRSEVPDARKAAEAIVEQWNQYLSGDVWGYEVVRIETCNLGHDHEDVVDSCWGYYGDSDYAKQEGQAHLEAMRRAAQ